MLGIFAGGTSKEPSNSVQTTEQEHVEVDANVVAPEEETPEQDLVDNFVQVDSNDADQAMEQALSESGVVSYVIRPLLYAAKGGFQVYT